MTFSSSLVYSVSLFVGLYAEPTMRVVIVRNMMSQSVLISTGPLMMSLLISNSDPPYPSGLSFLYKLYGLFPGSISLSPTEGFSQVSHSQMMYVSTCSRKQ